jgi:hypothetical protein
MKKILLAAVMLLAFNSAAFAVTEFVTVIKVLDNYSGIVERKNGERWHIEMGPEASFFWRYEGKQAQIKSPSTFCGEGVRILLPEDRQEAPVWNAKLIGDDDKIVYGRAASGGMADGTVDGGGDQARSREEAWRFRPEYDNKTVESAIDGRFEGWKGGTVVKLKNGQIWRQKRFYYHHCSCSHSPKVTILQPGSGYKMLVDGVPKAVEVERLE